MYSPEAPPHLPEVTRRALRGPEGDIRRVRMPGDLWPHEVLQCSTYPSAIKRAFARPTSSGTTSLPLPAIARNFGQRRWATKVTLITGRYGAGRFDYELYVGLRRSSLRRSAGQTRAPPPPRVTLII